MRVEHGVDFPAMSDYDNCQVQWLLTIGRGGQHGPSAILIDGVSTAAGCPLRSGICRYAVDDDVLHRCHMTATIEMIHCYGAELQFRRPRNDEHPLDGPAVIAEKRSVGAVPSIRLSHCLGSGTK